jgi:hypothetical protein
MTQEKDNQPAMTFNLSSYEKYEKEMKKSLAIKDYLNILQAIREGSWDINQPLESLTYHKTDEWGVSFVQENLLTLSAKSHFVLLKTMIKEFPQANIHFHDEQILRYAVWESNSSLVNYLLNHEDLESNRPNIHLRNDDVFFTALAKKDDVILTSLVRYVMKNEPEYLDTYDQLALLMEQDDMFVLYETVRTYCEMEQKIAQSLKGKVKNSVIGQNNKNKQ